MPPGWPPQGGGNCCGSNKGCAVKRRRKKAHGCAVPAGTPPQGGKVFCSTFCTLQKVGESREAAKDLIGLVRSFGLGALIRGLQNLESPLGKVLILLVGSCCSGGLIRGLENLRTPCKGNGFWYFLRRAKSTAKTRRGLRPSGLPGTIQSSAGEDFSKVFRRHEPNPAFRTKRRRKGFESVRGSGVTA